MPILDVSRGGQYLDALIGDYTGEVQLQYNNCCWQLFVLSNCTTGCIRTPLNGTSSAEVVHDRVPPRNEIKSNTQAT